ncbi:MAG: helix-turn-helix domain-containing protein [Deltaproteobacteria bacterium]|nr:helix-turn-helix domain-containing protein [Deltaproteobacteria bacterium]
MNEQEKQTPKQQAPAAASDPTYGLPAVLTVEETAAFLRLNPKTVHAAITAGELPGRKVGRRTLVLRDALLHWLKLEERVRSRRRGGR